MTYSQRLRELLDRTIQVTGDVRQAHPAVRALVGAKLWEAQGAINDALAMQAEREPVPVAIVGDEMACWGEPDDARDTEPNLCSAIGGYR